ncbi:CCR4-NOT transcription complex subunit 7 isoform X3 [Ictalurus furcatus]|uniref:CCR4-NOT transcription complex subunit 7 isoform X3 n=1 Tax=Ictalurus furcatus TaxID=66913 RepID=UPI002350BC4A|nr:CCR4-NOT transcription complex subunit 7 isoform X3 [Ictalurus furcatus]XP_053486722.1 CCR4-NOT transcription complex subunit 7 isoform X3 [Ictalurus furcatus]
MATVLKALFVNNPSQCRMRNFKLFGDGLITLPRLMSSNTCFSEVMADLRSSWQDVCTQLEHKLTEVLLLLREDMYAQDSIELLTTSGLQFKKHEEEGIETLYFAELLMTSGVVLCEGVKWLSFHSGYDFGYLIKILSNSKLPEEEVDFFEILRLFFPIIYDVKYLMKSCKNLKGGLQEVAEQLDLERIGPQHQAGSDSLLTGMAFFKMREVGQELCNSSLHMFFEDHIDDAKYCGHLYGLGSGSSYVQNGTGNAYEEEANKQQS